MKKILFAFTLIAGFSFATQAQSTDKETINSAEPVKVEVAGQVASDVTITEPSVAPVKESTAGKSCCSSKKGKETASAKSKSCCADGKKSKADCADKKDETTISQ